MGLDCEKFVKLENHFDFCQTLTILKWSWFDLSEISRIGKQFFDQF